jgi:trypsin
MVRFNRVSRVSIRALLLGAAVGLSLGAVAQPLIGSRGTAIVGGTEAAVGEFPFMVSLHKNQFSQHICGGTLISNRWILSAAHCFYDDRNQAPLRWTAYISLHAQSNKNEARAIKLNRAIIHPKFNRRTFDHDFALLEMSEAIDSPVAALNGTEIDIPTNGYGAMAMTAGWGSTKEGGNLSDPLMKVEVPLVSQSVCAKMYGNSMAVTDSMICAGFVEGGKDSCQGDSGGPLLVKDSSGGWLLAGVVSWGAGCARPNFPGVYAKVNSAKDWILATTSSSRR